MENPRHETQQKEAALSPLEKIEEMFRQTDEQGMLFVPKLVQYNSTNLDTEYYSTDCYMTWTKSDCDALIREAKDLIANLEKLAEICHNEISCPQELQILCCPENAEQMRNKLSPELFEIWNTYVKELRPEEAAVRIREGAASSKDELGFLFRAMMAPGVLVKEAAAIRLGEDTEAFEVLFFAQRYFLLCAADAPQNMINAIGSLFAEALVLHRFARSMVKTPIADE